VRSVGRKLMPVLPTLLRSSAGRQLVLRASVAHPERVPAEAAARLVRSYVTSSGYESADVAMRSEVFSDFENVRVPVTLAWGDEDRLVRRPRETVPEWRTIVLHGCGHIPTWDDPSQVARALLLASA
jgi:pimeloyl-ACP methyl ester carboxylesterase